MNIRIANRLIDINDYFISNHNRGRLIDEVKWNEYKEAKDIYKRALQKFAMAYENENDK